MIFQVKQPLDDKILVEPIEETLSSGIQLPDTAQEIPMHGRVVACGPDVVGVSEGDLVCWPRFAGIEPSRRTKLLLVSRQDLWAIMEPAPDGEAAEGSSHHDFGGATLNV